MLEINSKYEGPAKAPDAILELPFELRQKTRLRTQAKNGEDAWVMLPRGGILRGGDMLVANDGRVVAVAAKPEAVMEVRAADPLMLTKAAYHLGNRHVPVEIAEGYLRLADDHVLEKMLEGLGVTVTHLTAPFEPEAGAYGGGHTHGGMPSGGGRIHDMGGLHGIGGKA